MAVLERQEVAEVAEEAGEALVAVQEPKMVNDGGRYGVEEVG